MIMDKRGNLWNKYGWRRESVVVDRGWRTVEQFTATPLSRHGLPHNNVKSMCYDMDNDMLYIGTHLGACLDMTLRRRLSIIILRITNLPLCREELYTMSKSGKIKLLFPQERECFCSILGQTDLLIYQIVLVKQLIFDIDKNGTFYTTSGNNIKAISLDTPHKQEIISLHALGEVSHILSVDKKTLYLYFRQWNDCL